MHYADGRDAGGASVRTAAQTTPAAARWAGGHGDTARMVVASADPVAVRAEAAEVGLPAKIPAERHAKAPLFRGAFLPSNTQLS